MIDPAVFYTLVQKQEDDFDLENVNGTIIPINNAIDLSIRADYTGDKQVPPTEKGAVALFQDLGQRLGITFTSPRYVPPGQKQPYHAANAPIETKTGETEITLEVYI